MFETRSTSSGTTERLRNSSLQCAYRPVLLTRAIVMDLTSCGWTSPRSIASSTSFVVMSQNGGLVAASSLHVRRPADPLVGTDALSLPD